MDDQRIGGGWFQRCHEGRNDLTKMTTLCLHLCAKQTQNVMSLKYLLAETTP